MWHPVFKTSDIVDGQGISLNVPGRRKPVALFRWAGQFFAVNDECPHANAPLSGGKVSDFIVTCPSHGAKFDIRNGKSDKDFFYGDIKTFPVKIEGDTVYIEV
ncbi:MAG: non-heme iron oxygenase ferredoxin subunit [Candidatus Omnitrophica bacterium]|nr:non-heme iron oxygenase ferredoxin subunit [Candidatus Omnitrophota bacterium]